MHDPTLTALRILQGEGLLHGDLTAAARRLDALLSPTQGDFEGWLACFAAAPADLMTAECHHGGEPLLLLFTRRGEAVRLRERLSPALPGGVSA